MAPLHNISETCSVWLKFAVHFLSVQPTEKSYPVNTEDKTKNTVVLCI